VIGWRSVGAGPPLLLLEDPGYDWEAITTRMATMHRVLRVEMRADLGPPDALTNELVSVLDEAGVPVAIVVGGAAALAVAARRPARVTALVLFTNQALGQVPPLRVATLLLVRDREPGGLAALRRSIPGAEVAFVADDAVGLAQTLLDFTATL